MSIRKIETYIEKRIMEINFAIKNALCLIDAISIISSNWNLSWSWHGHKYLIVGEK